MKLRQVQKLLEKHSIPYTLTTEPSRGEYFRKKGFRPSNDTDPFCLLTVSNPYHSKNIEMVFADDSDDPEFYDLGFGGYWFDLFGWLDAALPERLIDEIQSILEGRSWVIFVTNTKNGAWISDSLFCDTAEEEWNDMESFHKTVSKLRKPGSLWRRLARRRDCYEIFNWTNYEKIIR